MGTFNKTLKAKLKVFFSIPRPSTSQLAPVYFIFETEIDWDWDCDSTRLAVIDMNILIIESFVGEFWTMAWNPYFYTLAVIRVANANCSRRNTKKCVLLIHICYSWRHKIFSTFSQLTGIRYDKVNNCDADWDGFIIEDDDLQIPYRRAVYCAHPHTRPLHVRSLLARAMIEDLGNIYSSNKLINTVIVTETSARSSSPLIGRHLTPDTTWCASQGFTVDFCDFCITRCAIARQVDTLKRPSDDPC